MSATTDGEAMDVATGFGVLFGLLAAGAAGVAAVMHELPRALGFGGAVLFGALLVLSLHLYE